MPLLVGSRGDSNMDDKTYAKSNLLCFLEAKSWKCLFNTIEAHFIFYRNMGNRDDILPVLFTTYCR